MFPLVRWRTAPPVDGCRRCGRIVRGHGWRYAGGNAHRYQPPTIAQRAARIRVHLLARIEALA